jgi:DNA-binding PadR family transcriptional regulator
MSATPRLTPQTIAVLRVLLATASTPRYGLDIAREAGLATGTVHPILARLEQAGWVEKFWEEPVEDAGRPRRRYYRFTAGGAEQARIALAAATQPTTAAASLRPQLGY